ncbi:hypothetical protein ABTE96_20480, partial [Acinetobacter baumannii]
NEAQRCDRISLMHAGRVLVSATPEELIRQRGSATLEQAFIAYLEEAAGKGAMTPAPEVKVTSARNHAPAGDGRLRTSLGRALSYSQRESL